MKRFDKGYIYSYLLSDLFRSILIFFIFLGDFFFDENTQSQDIASAIPVFLAAFCVIYLCFVAYRIMYYRTSGYELTETEIKCNRGVFFRKRSVLDYKRIHAVNKKQGIFHRIFGVAVLTVDSGSTNTAHQAEITITEKEKTVDALIDELNAAKDKDTHDVKNAPAEELLLSDRDSLYRFTSGKKMLYTLISIVSTAFFTALFALSAVIVVGLCKLTLQLDFLGTWGQYLLFALLITVGALLLFSAFSLVGCLTISFVRYHNFNITKHGNNIQISYGLIEKHTNTFSYNRIKAVKISQGLVQRMLGFATIKLEVIGYTRYTSDNENDSSNIGILVPFCKYEEIGEILNKIMPDYVPDKKQTKAVSFFPFVSWFFLIFGVIAGITLISAVAIMLILNAPVKVIFAVAFALLGVALIVLTVKSVSAALAYQINGIAINSEKITVYSGGFTKNVTVFMRKNLIAVNSVTTPLRKKAGISSLVLHLKTNEESNEVKVHIQQDNLLEQFEKLLVI